MARKFLNLNSIVLLFILIQKLCHIWYMSMQEYEEAKKKISYEISVKKSMDI